MFNQRYQAANVYIRLNFVHWLPKPSTKSIHLKNEGSIQKAQCSEIDTYLDLYSLNRARLSPLMHTRLELKQLSKICPSFEALLVGNE